MTVTNSESFEKNELEDEQLWTLHAIHDSLTRIEHAIALEMMIRHGTEQEAEYARNHLRNEFRRQAREAINGHD